jgi:hypothetical protein
MNKRRQQWTKHIGISKSVKPREKAHKYGAKAVAADDPLNPFGIRFSSTLEFEAYKAFHAAGLNFEHEPKFELQPAIQTEYKKYSAITFRPDFWFEEFGIFADIKSKPTVLTGFKMRVKMLMVHFDNRRKDLGRLDEPLPVVLGVMKGQISTFIQLLQMYGHHIKWPEDILKRFMI